MVMIFHYKAFRDQKWLEVQASVFSPIQPETMALHSNQEDESMVTGLIVYLPTETPEVTINSCDYADEDSTSLNNDRGPSSTLPNTKDTQTE